MATCRRCWPIATSSSTTRRSRRGPNTIFVFELDGLRVAHFGDFGQRRLREEQAAAIGAVDLLILPVGGGPTIGAAQAGAIVSRLGPRWVVPMHYRNERADFLPETEEEFVRDRGASDIDHTRAGSMSDASRSVAAAALWSPCRV